MVRRFASYKDWEDARSGLYAMPASSDEHRKILLAAELLKSPSAFYMIGLKMIESWPVSASVQLSNRSRNRQAWIGQASCCYLFGCPEHQTKEAWHRLTHEEQDSANRIADELINLWEQHQ